MVGELSPKRKRQRHLKNLGLGIRRGMFDIDCFFVSICCHLRLRLFLFLFLILSLFLLLSDCHLLVAGRVHPGSMSMMTVTVIFHPSLREIFFLCDFYYSIQWRCLRYVAVSLRILPVGSMFLIKRQTCGRKTALMMTVTVAFRPLLRGELFSVLLWMCFYMFYGPVPGTPNSKKAPAVRVSYVLLLLVYDRFFFI